MSTVKRHRNYPEKRTQRAIVNDLRMLGFFVADLTQPRKTMLPLGLPDLWVAHKRWGQAWIEVKSEKGKLTFDQVAWHTVARGQGVTVITARSTSDVLKALKIEVT